MSDDLFGNDRVALVDRARNLLVGNPRRVRDDHAAGSANCGLQCYELHLLGTGPKQIAFDGSDPLEGKFYNVMATWDIHAKRYDKVEAWFQRILREPYVVDLSEALQ